MIEKLLQELENHLLELKSESLEYQEKIRALLHKRTQAQNPISYFNYSTIIDKEKSGEHTVIGTFHLHNPSTLPLHNPVILLKINSDQPFDFSGKYVFANKPIQNETFFWERIEHKQSGSINEYSFRPVANKIIPPNDTFSFSNFQIRFSNEETGYMHVEGFIYYQEKSDGIASLNSISISY
ncbi:hypothetical protein [Peribacillus huizhouensis]|uniref:Uncharacterized protein n=1 Tax=Peribacillus huizhouensis TaxID=1501239 RepID=A0ABR6CNL0_9BACI|nr:hypothetical protein [Peribacillus huizhouensis]MBA9026271.1 hypothetical protein [Peribacillus huizhouensis]